MREREEKKCQNCHQEFTIEPEGFDFYEKMQVPPPTWCPECRLWRKALWRNERFLYKTKDAHDGKEIFSMYSPKMSVTVFEKDFWNSDEWDQLATGKEYDFSEPFFEQFKKLLSVAPIFSRSIVDLVRSDYSNNATSLKDCYLVFGSSYVENSFYSENCGYTKDAIDSSFVNGCEVSYEGFFNMRCYRAFFSSYCEESSDIWFCRDCIGVSNCFGCVGLRNKSYCIYNEQYQKEEYEARIREMRLSDYRMLSKLREEISARWLAFPVRFVRGRKNDERSTGEYISQSKNVRESYYVVGGEDLKYSQFLIVPPVKDAYDHFRFGNNTNLTYECLSVGGHSTNVKFSSNSYTNCANLQYCYGVLSSSDCFGCVGIHHKRFCILNKQYSEEEYQTLLPRIIAHMNELPYADSMGRLYRYGEFFPPELSNIPYNHSVAYEYFPMDNASVRKNGISWMDSEKRTYRPTMRSENLPERIEDVPDSITKEIVACAHDQKCSHECTGAFKILPEELSFYRKTEIPLPRLCSNCRYAERIKQRAPLKLWHRTCMKEGCQNEFETSYAPERPEIIYCESCYQKEVI